MDDLNEELGVGELNATVEEIDTRNETPKELKRRRGPTIMFDVTRIKSLGDKKVVRYNEDGAPIELKDKIFTTIEPAFVIDPRSRKNVLQTAGISFRQFKNWLTMKYIMPHKDEPQLLQVPPEKYSFIEQNQWKELVRSRLSETFQEKRQLQQDRQSKNKYNHRISRKGYANLKEEMDEISMNTDSSSMNRNYSNDVLTQALGTKEHNGRVRGVGGYITVTTQLLILITPTTYFHSVKKTSKDEANIVLENEELRRRVSELEAQIRSNLSTPLSAHGSCSRPIMLEGIEEKGKRIEVESLDKPKENEKKGKEVMKMNEPELDVLKERDLIKMPTEKEVVCESTSTLPLALKSILRYAEKCPLKFGSTTCGYYVMNCMREIVNRGSIVISDSIDTRKPYSQAELDEVRVELVEFLGGGGEVGID
ncbi:putative serine/threonine-protein kinase nek2 [Cucumis melo var. makuwa]|uniref:Serine/threonine-protein kinase nek2 n=1 Tax=Cucumis melo var. makuwa TaxID=1194695 RepID=A0A5A7V3I1_CUCMM|nr:putative serine/threonine-protein kinase nek2 [Cucumis melo var. makuwa]